MRLSSERQKVGLTAGVRPRERVCCRSHPRDASRRPGSSGCRPPTLTGPLIFQENSPWKSSSEGPRATRPLCASCSVTPAAPASSEPGATNCRAACVPFGFFFFFWPNNIDSDAVPPVVGCASFRAAFSFSVVDASWECLDPPRLWKHGQRCRAQTVVFVVLTIFHHYCCYYFSFDSEVCVLKLKTRGGEGRENNTVQ